MEPITVTCSTCQSRIRVRNRNLIGQIVNCPKCQSMIMIADPGKVELTPQPNAMIDSMSVTKDDLPSIASDGDRFHVEAEHLSDVNDPFSEEEYRLAPPDSTERSVQFAPATPPAWSPEPAPLIPDDGWTTEGTVKRRQLLLIVFGGLASLIVSAVLLIVFLQSSKTNQNPKQTIVAEQGDGANGDDGVATVENAHASESLTGAPVASKDSSATSANDAPFSMDGEQELINSNSPSPDALTGESTPTVGSGQSDRVAADLPDPSVPIDITKSDPNSSRPISSSDAAVIDNGANIGSGDQAQATPAVTASDDVPKLLVDFAPMLDWRIQPVLPDTEAIPTNAPLTAEELGVAAGGSDPATAAPSIQQELTSRKLAGVAIKNRPIWHVVNTWTNLTGIPTSVALDTLSFAGVDRNTRVSLQSGSQKDVWSLANELAATMGLIATVREERYIELSVAREELKAIIPLSVRLPAKVDEAAMQVWLVDQLSTLFPEGVPSLSISEGELRIAADQVGDQRWLDTIRVVDQWRVSLGEESQFKGVQNEMLSALWNPDPELPALDKVCQTLTTQPQGFGVLLSRVCGEAELACWMDWPNLGAIGVTPQASRLYVTNARPLRNILKDFSTETGAVVAALDSNSIWISSPNGYRRQPKTFIAPIGERSIEDWTRELRVFTPLDENNNQFLPIIKTPDDKFIMFRCCLPFAEL